MEATVVLFGHCDSNSSGKGDFKGAGSDGKWVANGKGREKKLCFAFYRVLGMLVARRGKTGDGNGTETLALKHDASLSCSWREEADGSGAGSSLALMPFIALWAQSSQG